MKSPQRTLPGRLNNGRLNKRESAVLAHHSRQMAKVIWDVAEDGGAVGDISFGLKLPAGSIVTSVMTDEQTAVAGADDVTLSAGATALVSNMDLTGDAGVHVRFQASPALVDDNTDTVAAVQPVKLSVASELKITIATNAATAGKVVFLVEYLDTSVNP